MNREQRKQLLQNVTYHYFVEQDNSKSGVITVASTYLPKQPGDEVNDRLFVGLAFCSPKDRFVKKIGRTIAFKDLVSSAKNNCYCGSYIIRNNDDEVSAVNDWLNTPGLHFMSVKFPSWCRKVDNIWVLRKQKKPVVASYHIDSQEDPTLPYYKSKKYIHRKKTVTQEELNKKLCNAAENGQLDEVKDCLTHGADIHAKNDYVLRWAARYGHLEIVKELIACGADVRACNDCALRWTAEKGHLEVVKELIAHGADVHAKNNYALRWAACNGHLEVVKELIAHGVDVRADDDDALRFAAYYGHLEVAKELIAYGANVRAKNNYALRWAAENGHLEVVKELITCGADVHANNDYALCWAAEKGHLEVVKELIAYGADVHIDNDCALRWAACKGHLEVVKELIAHGADVHANNDWCFKNGTIEIINYLNSLQKTANLPHCRGALCGMKVCACNCIYYQKADKVEKKTKEFENKYYKKD